MEAVFVYTTGLKILVQFYLEEANFCLILVQKIDLSWPVAAFEEI